MSETMPSLRIGTTHRLRTILAIALVGCVWIAAVAAGFRTLMQYESRPGAPASAPARWPADAPLALDSARPTLLLFAHPHCPCTRATLGELDRLLARANGRIRAHVLFYSDPALGADWARTDLWEQAAGMPGVEVHEDLDGKVAKLFGARTSGQVLLYAQDGALLFQGGITAARGRAGESGGARSVLALAQGETAEHTACSVFGCPLTSNPSPSSEEPDP
jgi:hypothetical protein